MYFKHLYIVYGRLSEIKPYYYYYYYYYVTYNLFLFAISFSLHKLYASRMSNVICYDNNSLFYMSHVMTWLWALMCVQHGYLCNINTLEVVTCHILVTLFHYILIVYFFIIINIVIVSTTFITTVYLLVLYCNDLY